MHIFRLLLAALLLTTAALGQTGTYAITNVAVIPMDRETVLQHQTVVVEGGKISKVGAAKSTKLPKGVQKIDG
ncbi:MAG TPA: hypothetical protein VG897_17915, partial [Terriglobales bacterium]|nr:hypothetical protein [Terriglobales bacterium]